MKDFDSIVLVFFIKVSLFFHWSSVSDASDTQLKLPKLSCQRHLTTTNGALGTKLLHNQYSNYWHPGNRRPDLNNNIKKAPVGGGDCTFWGREVDEIAHLPQKGELHVLIREYPLAKGVLQPSRLLNFTTCTANLDKVARSSYCN